MTKKEVKGEIADLSAIQDITNTYEQVAATRMRKIKDTIVQNRDFYESLSEIYFETQRCYQQSLVREKKFVSKYSNNSGGGSVAVLLTANTGLYGKVVKEVYNQFVKDSVNSKNDLVVVGQQGRRWMQDQDPNVKYKYFNLSDGTDNLDEQIKLIYDYISKYADVVVYHGIFKNIIEQPVTITKITQNTQIKNDEGETLLFLFEPTIDKVLEFFEKQLTNSFFDQTIHESALAKYGSRMLGLDSATQNVSKILQQTRFLSTKMNHTVQNRKQQELVYSSVLWE
jgi:F-type H+-transporting ATPase subunit gamma